MTITIRLNWLIIPLIALCAWLLSSYFMPASTWSWYYKLSLPAITPPGWFIAYAWQLIYVLTTICALIVFNMFAKDIRFWFIIITFIANVVLNVSWTYIFFTQHLIGYAALCAAALTATVWLLIWLIRPTSLLTALLLLPYGLWSAFATFLNVLIWLNN